MTEKQSKGIVIEGPEGTLQISPPLFPENHGWVVDPADLSKFAPSGNSVYGYQELRFRPFEMAPIQEEAGGVLFFGNGIAKEDFMALTRISSGLINYTTDRDYAAFFEEVPDLKKAGKHGFIRQLRLVSKFALRHHFGVLSDQEYQQFPEQELTMAEAMWAFIKHEKKAWGTFFGGKLERTFGGDANFAREELNFGFMIENSDGGIYRIWSRAWLVTK